MSVLYLRSRPIIAFDATNPNHRQWYSDFVKHRGWGRCPVRFIAESLEVDLVTFIEHKLLTYYVQQEFENGPQKTRKSKRTKSKTSRTLRLVRAEQSVPSKTDAE